ncbi:esterase/lipase family protein [Haloferula sp.]|uniref:esterase/lipase family protein n=1 Tax=Haloferula sp. TaxID=2497595 RepID=UPI0032A05F00
MEATKTSQALTSSTALEQGTRKTLREEDLLKLYKHDSHAAINELAARFGQDSTQGRRLALAEMSSDQADFLTAENPMAALGRYLDAAWLTKEAAIVSQSEGVESTGKTIYDYSVARITRLIHGLNHNDLKSAMVSGSFRSWQLTIAEGEGKVDPRDFDVVVPTSWLKTKGIEWERITQDGLGAPMVGHRKDTPERRAADPMMPPGGRGVPLNASVRFEGNSAKLVLQNLMDESDIRVGNKTMPLAGDFSAAVSFTYHDKKTGVNKLAAMFRPGNYQDMIGMYSLTPYDPDRIPLILVHGLMSTAEGWLPFVNLLLADPVVREKYQILLFSYPTGITITNSAADLRDALTKFQKDHDPGRRNPKMRNMVILGHSMGGIITNMQIRDSGDRLYKTVFSKNLDELGLEKEVETEVRRLAFFKANPDIERALLLAAPLRGSDFAMTRIGQFGAWLITLPFDVIDNVLGDSRIFSSMTSVGLEYSQRSHNSVTSLRPDNPTLQAVLDSPVRKGISIHSIMGQKDPKLPKEEGTDGFVSYRSAHLDYSVSEVVVPNSNHTSMVHRNETIEEIWRVLRLHAGKN